MSFLFYKKGSNAKIMNNLCFNLILSDNSILVKNNKIENQIELSQEELNLLSSIKNTVYRSFYSDILFIKNGIRWIFENTDDKYHKYINIKIKCFSIYAENALKEWMYKWFSVEDGNINKELIYYNDLNEIYNQFKKCKITVN